MYSVAKVTSDRGKNGKKRTSFVVKKENLSDFESRMMARFEEQYTQFESVSA